MPPADSTLEPDLVKRSLPSDPPCTYSNPGLFNVYVGPACKPVIEKVDDADIAEANSS